jgi:hypothetical protein
MSSIEYPKKLYFDAPSHDSPRPTIYRESPVMRAIASSRAGQFGRFRSEADIRARRDCRAFDHALPRRPRRPLLVREADQVTTRERHVLRQIRRTAFVEVPSSILLVVGVLRGHSVNRHHCLIAALYRPVACADNCALHRGAGDDDGLNPLSLISRSEPMNLSAPPRTANSPGRGARLWSTIFSTVGVCPTSA